MIPLIEYLLTAFLGSAYGYIYARAEDQQELEDLRCRLRCLQLGGVPVSVQLPKQDTSRRP